MMKTALSIVAFFALLGIGIARAQVTPSPDTAVVTAPSNNPVPVGSALITVPNRTQQTLANALANAGGASPGTLYYQPIGNRSGISAEGTATTSSNPNQSGYYGVYLPNGSYGGIQVVWPAVNMNTGYEVGLAGTAATPTFGGMYQAIDAVPDASDGSTGFVAGDTCTLAGGGTFSNSIIAGVLRVALTNGAGGTASGGVLKWTVQTGGAYQVPLVDGGATGVCASTSGSGSGAKIDFKWNEVADFMQNTIVTSPWSGTGDTGGVSSTTVAIDSTLSGALQVGQTLWWGTSGNSPIVTAVGSGTVTVSSAQTIASNTAMRAGFPTQMWQGNGFTNIQQTNMIQPLQPLTTQLVTNTTPIYQAPGSYIGISYYMGGLPTPLGRYSQDNGGVYDFVATGTGASLLNYTNKSAKSGALTTQLAQPVAVLGYLPRPHFWMANEGDSIGCGAWVTQTPQTPPYDSPSDAYGGIGWWERGTAGQYATMNNCRSGDGWYRWYTLSNGVYTPTGSTMRHDSLRQMPLLNYAVVNLEMCTNDFAQTETATVVEGYILAELSYLQSIGISHFIVDTCFPQTTSSGNLWTTQAGQTARSWAVPAAGAQQVYNAWLRSGAMKTAAAAQGVNAANLYVFDVDALIESGVALNNPTGLFCTNDTMGLSLGCSQNVTNDGIHIVQAAMISVGTAYNAFLNLHFPP